MTAQAAPPQGPGEIDSPEARSRMMNAVLAQNWWAFAVRGVAAVLFGVIALMLPAAAALALVLLFAAYLLVDGVFAIVAAVRAARRHERWGLMIFEGVVDLIAAAIAMLLPIVALVAFVILVAAWAVVTGALALAAAFRLHADHGRVWLAIAGIASIVFGLLLIASPLIGAVVLTWWIGAYALISGVSLCVLAFRLRRHEHPHAGAALAA